MSFFLYFIWGGLMTVYIDGLLFLNFFLDFLLLLSVAIALKRNAKIYRIIIGAFIGSLTIVILFLKINTIQLFFIKLYLSFIMILIVFGYKDLKTFLTNTCVFYTLSILLGGFLYFINNEFHCNNVLFLIIFSPIILYIYIKQSKMYKNKIKNIYKINIFINKSVLYLTGYLDTGNMLTYKNKPVIITNIENSFKNKKIYIPYIVVGSTGVLECIKIRKAEVIGLGVFENIYLGFNKNMKISGVDVLLNGLMEG